MVEAVERMIIVTITEEGSLEAMTDMVAEVVETPVDRIPFLEEEETTTMEELEEEEETITAGEQEEVVEGEGSLIRMADLAECLEEVEEEARTCSVEEEVSLTKEAAPHSATLVAVDSLTKEVETEIFLVLVLSLL